MYLEENIQQYMTFLNKGYYVYKNQVIQNIKEQQKKYNKSIEKSYILKEKLNKLNEDYKETVRSLDIKRDIDILNNLENDIKNNTTILETIEKDILELKNQQNHQISRYNDQISEIESLISQLDNKKNLTLKKYLYYENQIKLKKSDIKEKRKIIQSYLKNFEREANKNNLMSTLIRKIKNTLEDKEKSTNKYDLTKSYESFRVSQRSNVSSLFSNTKELIINDKNRICESPIEQSPYNKLNSDFKRTSLNFPFSKNEDLSNDNLIEESYFQQKYKIDSDDKSRFSKTTNTRTNQNKLSKSSSQIELKTNSVSGMTYYISSPRKGTNRDVNDQPKCSFIYESPKKLNIPLKNRDLLELDKMISTNRSEMKTFIYNRSSSQVLKNINQIDNKNESCNAEDLLIIEKLKQMIKGVKCLIRVRNKTLKNKYEDFDPFKTYRANYIIDKMKFKNSYISLDKSLKKLITDNNTKPTIYLLSEIENLEISRKMSDILHIVKFHQNHLPKKDLGKSMGFAKIEQHLLINEDYKEKCLAAKYYMFVISLKNQFKIEVIFYDVNDFKFWSKNLEFVIKNQYKISFMHNKI